MIFYLIFLVLLLIIGCSIRQNNNNPLNVQETDAIKGLGILIVFVDHIRGYFNANNSDLLVYESYTLIAFQLATTLMVGMFLFFSGYGVTLSIINKGDMYVKTMPQKRLLTTLFNFDIAVVVFLSADLLLNILYPPLHVGLSLVGWESIGNSNWYIFAILCCYLFSFISSIFFSKIIYAACLTSFFVIVYIIVLSLFKEPWWYNTIIGYVGGMWYAIFKEHINSFLNRNYGKILLLIICAFCTFFRFSSNFIACNISVLLFGLLLVLFSMRISLSNRFLIWCGKHLFPLYIYQRLPMLVISVMFSQFVTAHPYCYFLICLAITLIIAKWMPQFKFNQISRKASL